MRTAQWAGVPVWELYGGTPAEWADWYNIAAVAVTQADAELSMPVEQTRYG